MSDFDERMDEALVGGERRASNRLSHAHAGDKGMDEDMRRRSPMRLSPVTLPSSTIGIPIECGEAMFEPQLGMFEIFNALSPCNKE